MRWIARSHESDSYCLITLELYTTGSNSSRLLGTSHRATGEAGWERENNCCSFREVDRKIQLGIDVSRLCRLYVEEDALKQAGAIDLANAALIGWYVFGRYFDWL